MPCATNCQECRGGSLDWRRCNVDTLGSYSKKKAKTSRKYAQRLFTNDEKCAIRAKMTDAYKKHGVSKEVLLAMESIQDLKAHPATAAILDQLQSHFAISLDYGEVLIRLQYVRDEYEESCRAPKLTLERIAERFPNIMKKASHYILSEYWHLNIQRHRSRRR